MVPALASISSGRRTGTARQSDDDSCATLTVKKVQYAREGTVFRLRRKAGFFIYEGKDGGSMVDRAASAANAETVFLGATPRLRRTRPERVAQPEQQLCARHF